MRKSKGGFSLIEVLISIALLGLLMVPISSGMLMSYRINEKSESIMQARLAVSSAAEALMAEGVGYAATVPPSGPVEITVYDPSNGYHNVTVSSKVENDIKVTIFVREEGVRAP